MADEEHYMASLPTEPTEFFDCDGRLVVVYEEDGKRKAAWWTPPDRYYPMDTWILDWGDLAGVADSRPIMGFVFQMRMYEELMAYEQWQKGQAGTEKAP